MHKIFPERLSEPWRKIHGFSMSVASFPRETVAGVSMAAGGCLPRFGRALGGVEAEYLAGDSCMLGDLFTFARYK